MKIAIGTDHRGREKKLETIAAIKDKYEIIDASKENNDTDDYPKFAYLVSKEVLSHNADFGVLICGTGIGMSIAANKIKGIRCALVHTSEEAKLAREHNGANVLAFSETAPLDVILKSIEAFASASELGDKHARRREQIIKLEAGEYIEL